jgi:hypothetical protein
MIDFIVVSNSPASVAELERTLHSAMAGMPAGSAGEKSWRLVTVDGNTHDLFTGYNAGAAQGHADVLAFLHHDVRVHANSIALERPLELLKNPAVGFIGVCGATRLNAQGTWWGDLPQPQMLSYCRGAVGCPDGNPFGMNLLAWPGGAAVFGPALVVDGVFLMCHRRTFDALHGFDAATFKGFHFYDVDITLRAHFAGLRNFVAPIPLFHMSTGKYDHVWEAARQIFVRKFAGRLPCQL